MTELETVFDFDEINAFWKVFTNSDDENGEYDFDTTLNLLQTLGEKYGKTEREMEDFQSERVERPGDPGYNGPIVSQRHQKYVDKNPELFGLREESMFLTEVKIRHGNYY